MKTLFQSVGVILALILLASPGVNGIAQSIEYAVYLPLIVKPILSTPTPTLSPTPTWTHTPTHTPTQTPTPTPTQTHTPVSVATTGRIDILSINYNGSGSLEPDEYVRIRNIENFPIQVEDWTLRDNANHVFMFPSFIIEPNQECRIYTNENHPEWCGLSYNNGAAIWNNGGDCAFLNNSQGELVDNYCY